VNVEFQSLARGENNPETGIVFFTHCAVHLQPRRYRLLPSKINKIRAFTLIFERLFLAAYAVMARIRTVFADKGYDAEPHRDLCRSFGSFGVKPQIYLRGQPSGSGLGQRRWPVERSNTWVLENRRLALRHDRLGFIIQSLLQAACIFLVARRLAGQF
jgi:transposase